MAISSRYLREVEISEMAPVKREDRLYGKRVYTEVTRLKPNKQKFLLYFSEGKVESTTTTRFVFF